MLSLIAALRTLTLPFGVTSGTRIVLDGVNGRISVFDANNTESMRMDSNGGYLVVNGSGGGSVTLTSTGTAGQVQITPPTGLANPTTPGFIEGLLVAPMGTARPGMRMVSPVDSTVGQPGQSGVAVTGRTATNGTSEVDLWGDAVIVTGPLTVDSAQINGGNRLLSGSLSTENQRLIFGTSVLTTNGTGDVTVSPGLTTLRGFVAWNGDTVRNNMVIGNNRGLWPVTGNTVGVKCTTGNTGATINNTAVRIDWLAFGVA